MSNPNPSSAPRIAISFGTPKSSNSARDQSKPKPPPSRLGKRARPHALGHDSHSDDSDSDSDPDRRGRHEAITELGGEEAPKKRPRELVIESQPNRNWKDELRAKRGGGGKKNLLPPEVQARKQKGREDPKETAPADGVGDEEIQWGLAVKKRKTEQPSDEEGDGDERDRRQSSSRSPGDDGDNERTNSKEGEDDAPRDKTPPPGTTADDEAMDALLGRRGKNPDAERVIRPATEDEAYQEDVQRHVGADSTLNDYDAIPDGEFGAALLRGMGWDGKLRGPRPRATGERRQNLLGLGAKRLKEDEDLGQWNHGGGSGGRGKGRGGSKRPPRLHDYRREEEKRKAERRERRGEGYREERERDGDRDRYRDRDRERDNRRDRERDGDRGYRNGDSRRY
ncbi:hypothetical protein SODALDRAFT_323987 [Sodiomyces alkalinus F11]|uniref:Pre-mRNA-splicing factor n=1 Tax=Sodiomyces alkalinus (strain CBS 110278 / VKM F-3762 / F11) TaxID=1314773 RepID=A0A3N2PVJ6_SODAK|nr:hypothetical protein SODALDRAFT_323987 [Sodiomyces alkalinus F11]ROT38521.1 hypothetical protein SODALDRAFT_323987 [Sodiomyces alkalinus F11]